MTDPQAFDYDLMEQEQAPFVRRLMVWIVNRLRPGLVDLGAGSGMYVAAARESGWPAQGFDVTDRQKRPQCVIQQSLLTVTHPAHTVLCIEVAEHLPQQVADQVIQSVWRNTLPGGHVVWSAAQPGQGGVGHVNCQPPDYWRALACEQGLEPRPDLEQDLHAWITSGYHMGWFARNRQIWQRPQ